MLQKLGPKKNCVKPSNRVPFFKGLEQRTKKLRETVELGAVLQRLGTKKLRETVELGAVLQRLGTKKLRETVEFGAVRQRLGT